MVRFRPSDFLGVCEATTLFPALCCRLTATGTILAGKRFRQIFVSRLTSWWSERERKQQGANTQEYDETDKSA